MADFGCSFSRKLDGYQGWDKGSKADSSPKEGAERKRPALVQITAERGGLLCCPAFSEHLPLPNAAVGRACWRRKSRGLSFGVSPRS